MTLTATRGFVFHDANKQMTPRNLPKCIALTWQLYANHPSLTTVFSGLSAFVNISTDFFLENVLSCSFFKTEDALCFQFHGTVGCGRGRNWRRKKRNYIRGKLRSQGLQPVVFILFLTVCLSFFEYVTFYCRFLRTRVLRPRRKKNFVILV